MKFSAFHLEVSDRTHFPIQSARSRQCGANHCGVALSLWSAFILASHCTVAGCVSWGDRYTIWPMVCGMLGKFAVTAWESSRIKLGMHRLALRKLSTTIASACIFISVPAFTIAPTPLLATLAYCGVSLGGCFEYPGFIGNLLEVCSIALYWCKLPSLIPAPCVGGRR